MNAPRLLQIFYVPRKTHPKVFTFYVKTAESFYVVRKNEAAAA